MVLQEIPRIATSIIRRSGDKVIFSKPEIETFAENVGILTQEVFKLEVTESGFYRLLIKELESSTYSELMEKFGDQIGGEGKLIAISSTDN